MNVYIAQTIKIKRYQTEESEKIGYDIGEEKAAKDWVRKYAEGFRSQWNKDH